MFWRGQYAQEAGSAIDAEGVRRMVEWFVIDYRYGPDRKRLIDLFIETEAAKFVPDAAATWSRPGPTRAWVPFAMSGAATMSS